jgi:uncharacterized protein (TIGR02466 family)
MNNIDQELWTHEAFYNPFGPNLLRLKINEDIRLKLLDLIKDHQANVWEEKQILQGQSAYDHQKNSIVDGKFGEISEKWQEEYYGNIITNTIQSVLCRYGELHYDMPCVASVESVWYVIMKSGDFHMLHAHIQPQSQVSGAIYLEIPDNLPDPQGSMNWVLGGSQKPLYNNMYKHSPELGDVFLWPAELMHTVYPFRSKQERIMISFNGVVEPIENKEDNG